MKKVLIVGVVVLCCLAIPVGAVIEMDEIFIDGYDMVYALMSTVIWPNVNGTIVAGVNQVCIAGDCRAAWPAGGSPNGTDINVTDLVVDGDAVIGGDLDVDGYLNVSSVSVLNQINLGGNIVPEWGFPNTLDIGSSIYYSLDNLWANDLYATYWRDRVSGNPRIAFSTHGTSFIEGFFAGNTGGVTDSVIDIGSHHSGRGGFGTERFNDIIFDGDLSDGINNVTVAEILTNSSDITVPGQICDTGGANCIGDGGGSTPTSGRTTFRFRDGFFEVRVS